MGILKVLVDGYEGNYLQSESGYSYVKKGGGERYRLLAFEPKYFPGSGFLEPLGVVHAVRNANLLRVKWVRAEVLDPAVTSTERMRPVAATLYTKPLTLPPPCVKYVTAQPQPTPKLGCISGCNPIR